MDAAGPVPLRLPAILQNPVNQTQRQVEAYREQQREKAAARRDAASKAEAEIAGSKRGKRVVRRMNNAAFVDNPHAVAPRRTDYAPSVPLHPRPLAPAFPPGTIERSAPIPPAAPRGGDPFAPSSAAGAFTTSLKGTRQLLRRGGHRSQVLVPVVEDAVRSWLGGEFSLGAQDDLAWRVIDRSETPYGGRAGQRSSNGSGGSSSSSSSGNRRRIPPQHAVRTALPPLPVTNSMIPALLELSRSAAHVTWLAADPYDRLIVHLVARYYDLVSWSENLYTVAGDHVRLTHIVRPSVAHARAPPPGAALLTPETSDVSASSASEAESSASGTERGDDSEAETETETEGGDVHSEAAADGDDPDTSYQSLSERYAHWATESEPDTDEDLHARLGSLALSGMPLHRTASHASHGSSAYASSEGGSDMDAALDGVSAGSGSAFAPSEPALSPVTRTFDMPALPNGSASGPVRSGPVRLNGTSAGDWADKPTLFEFVYGA